jgi:hypothetical protein
MSVSNTRWTRSVAPADSFGDGTRRPCRGGAADIKKARLRRRALMVSVPEARYDMSSPAVLWGICVNADLIQGGNQPVTRKHDIPLSASNPDASCRGCEAARVAWQS